MTLTSHPELPQQQMGKAFVLGGNAYFTLVGLQNRFTYRVSRKDPEPGSRYTDPTYFVALLTGTNNESDYSYVGILNPVTGEVKLTKGSRMKADAPAVRAIQWAMRIVLAGRTLPAPSGLFHEGRCGRCGRALTVPESIITGFGPDCAKLMGLGMPGGIPTPEPFRLTA